jgi:hypothetical protein
MEFRITVNCDHLLSQRLLVDSNNSLNSFEIHFLSKILNPLTPELNPSVKRCLTRFFSGDFASSTVHFVNICVKNQQMQQLFIQFINYVW